MMTVASGAALAIMASLGTTTAHAAATRDPGPELPEMTERRAADFVDDAATLPEGLVEAVRRDLALAPEEYLANAAAAAEAVEVVEGLDESGVEVLGSRIDGTELTVYVDDAADAALVESVGARVIFGAPPVPPLDEHEFTPADDVHGGQAWSWRASATEAWRCSIGFAGHGASGEPLFASAGHCFEGIESRLEDPRILTQSKPSAYGGGFTTGPTIGAPLAGSVQFGDHYDIGLLEASGGAIVPRASVLTWGSGGKSAPLGSTPLAVRGQTAAIVGANLCKSGATSGWTCGKVSHVDVIVSYGEGLDADEVNAIVATTCVLEGDSGGSAVIGSLAAGIASGSSYTSSCSERNRLSVFFPMVSSGGFESVAERYGAGWETSVTISRPSVTTSGGGSAGSVTSMRGTVSGAASGTTISLYLDGSSTPISTRSAAGGSWSFSLSGLPAGRHSYRLQAHWGDWSASTSQTGTFNIAQRLAGADRYATGLAIVKEWDKSRDATVVYVATGANYPDALSAGAAAVHVGAPVVLTPPKKLPSNVRQQIVALNPDRIVILGSTAAISTSVASSLASIVGSGNVVRLAGADRYATSLAVTRTAFTSGGVVETTPTVFIATGTNFPDALSAGAAAASVGGPVILVDGRRSKVPAATVKLIRDLGATRVVVAGSPAAVSRGIQKQLDALPGVSVSRYGGADRYATSQLINAAFFSTAPQAFFSTGTNYPDALAGAALAGSLGAPLVVTRPNCVPGSVLSSLASWNTQTVTLLGSAAALKESVARLARC